MVLSKLRPKGVQSPVKSRKADRRSAALEEFRLLLHSYQPELREKQTQHEANQEWLKKTEDIWQAVETLRQRNHKMETTTLAGMVTACWSFGFTTLLRRGHRIEGTSRRETEQRRQVQKYARAMRALAAWVDDMRGGGRAGNRLQRSIRELLIGAFYGVHEKDQKFFERFPQLADDLRSCADAVERCLTDPTDPTRPRPRQDAVLRRFRQENLRQLKQFATDPDGVTHWMVPARLITLIHPELKLIGDDLRREANRLLG